MTEIRPLPTADRSRPRTGSWLHLAHCAALLVMAGCAVGPDYHRPAVDIPKEFHGNSAPDASNSLADLPWWQIFNDSTLTNLIHQALTNNYDLRIAAARVEQSRALAIQTRSQFFPQVNYDLDAYRGKNALSGSANPKGAGATGDSFIAALNASWEIDLWGRIRRLNEAARAQFLATEEAQRGVRLSLITDVAQAYFQLLELDAELEIARRTTNSFGETLKIFTLRRRGGVASKLETDRAEGALDAVAATVPDLEQRIRLQENQLKVLLGEGSGTILRGSILRAQGLPPEVPAGLPSALLERRPDIREAEEVLRAANARIGVAVGNFFPQIGLTALLGGVSQQLSALTAPQSRLWSVGVQAAGPLFQAGLLHGQYRQLQAAADEARLQYQETALRAFHEVAGQLFTRQKYAQARVRQLGSVAAYQDAVQVATERYQSGHATYFEILDAQQQLFPEENALAQTQLNQLLVIVRLYKSLGGGWNQPP